MMSLWARLIDKDKQYVYSNDYKGDVVDGRFSELLGGRKYFGTHRKKPYRISNLTVHRRCGWMELIGGLNLC